MNKQETWKKLLDYKLVKGVCPTGMWNLEGINFRGINLDSADLTNCDLMVSFFFETSMVNANLRGSKLDGAVFIRSNLENADFSDSKLWWATMQDNSLKGAIFKGADLSKTHFYPTDLKSVETSGADLSQSIYKPEELDPNFGRKVKIDANPTRYWIQNYKGENGIYYGYFLTQSTVVTDKGVVLSLYPEDFEFT